MSTEEGDAYRKLLERKAVETLKREQRLRDAPPEVITRFVRDEGGVVVNRRGFQSWKGTS